MNKLVFPVIFLLLSINIAIAHTPNERLIVLADMGNEPDEEQQMVHLLLYANELDIEGLIAVTGKYLNPSSANPYKQVLHPELLQEIIGGYEKVVDNLKLHADGWPSADYLRSVVSTGQTGYGVEATGTGKSSPGSELLIQSFLKDDTRPLNVVVNAGSNTLAQALIDFEARYGKEKLDEVIRKLRVFENGAQDDAGAWICSRYPAIHWIRSNYQTYCYGGPGFDTKIGWEEAEINLGPYTWQPYEYSGMGQHQWMLEYKGNELGKHYPLRHHRGGYLAYLEGGGTIPWLGLIHQGLSDRMYPHWGGWSGRFTSEKKKNVWSRHQSVKESEQNYGDFYLYTEVSDKWTNPETDSTYNNIYTPVWRWRRAMFNNFKCRMHWCTAGFENANHNPVAAFNGNSAEKIHFLSAKPGETIKLDASASYDPDGDEIKFNWWVYQEAGTYTKEVIVKGSNQKLASCIIPDDAKGYTIHVILEIQDKNQIASLFDYRRVVVDVE
ncbi:MAG: DUF1593 domain-containing protein [Bacteroidetes bacterium]|nr:DUF1593 domain-containing protein [Bacteroidota bacterium]